MRDRARTSSRRSTSARRSDAGADAIHPGYGFLAESAGFAEAVEAAGLSWIGPPPDALRAGGDKLEAKRIAREAGVPVVPAARPRSSATRCSSRRPRAAAAAGCASSARRDELDDAVEAARREAKAAFGDDRLFFERYLERPRHVEIQLLADAHGTVLALGERECSVQRRHQKVLEESPVAGARRRPARADERRRGRASRARSATSAPARPSSCSTGREFFFLELNGRIQVEHPVTEAVTGVDLVE